MSVFLVYVRDDKENKPAMRETHFYFCDIDPPEPYWCADIVVADSREQAKHLFLTEKSQYLRTPIYAPDDWPLLRVRLLTHDESLGDNERWLRVHEVLDHGGRSCNCPTEDDVLIEASAPEGIIPA